MLAHAYLSVARAAFPSKATRLLREIESTLTPDELEQAKATAAELPSPSLLGTEATAGPARKERPLTPTLDDGFRSGAMKLKSAADLREERSR